MIQDIMNTLNGLKNPLILIISTISKPEDKEKDYGIDGFNRY